jgi:lipopolysaccharide transport system permease protein
LPVTVYSPESPLRHPIRLIREIFADLWRCRELVWILFTRDLKAQYRQTYFGYVWLFVPVISTTIIWMFLNSTRVIQVAATPIPYPAYVLLGSMIWGVFTASVNQPLNSFNAGRAVFMKLKVPPEAFILAGFSKIVFELLIRMLVLVPVFFALKMVPAATFWLFPVGMAAAVLVGVALGFLMLPLGSLYTDVSRLVSTGLSFAMYLTPVVYPPPETGWASIIIHANPLTAIVMTTRDWLTIGHSDYLLPFLLITLLAAVVLFIGIIIFRVVLPHLIERMGM